MSLAQKKQELRESPGELNKYIAMLIVDARHTEFWELLEETVDELVKGFSVQLFSDVNSINDNALLFEARGALKALRHLMEHFDLLVRNGTQAPPPGIGEEDVAHQR